MLWPEAAFVDVDVADVDVDDAAAAVATIVTHPMKNFVSFYVFHTALIVTFSCFVFSRNYVRQ